MGKGSRYSVDLFHKAQFVAEQYGYALRSCYKLWPFQELPKPENLPRKNDSCLREVFEWEDKFLEVFCDYEDLFPEYSREDFYWRLLWEGEEKRTTLFDRLEDVKEQFWSLASTVAIAEGKVEAERKGIEAWKAAKTPPQAEGKGGEIPAYRWELNEERHEVSCNGSKPVKLEPRLFKILTHLYNKKGNRVQTKELERATKLSRDGVREAVSNLKRTLASSLKIDRKEMDKIIMATENKNRKIIQYTFSI